jgi:hypothetical protein
MRKNLDIRESKDQGVFIPTLIDEPVDDSLVCLWLFSHGGEQRTVAATKQNDTSSRSHAIFRINLKIEEHREREHPRYLCSEINLVDLAGSESVSKNKAQGLWMDEGVQINKSLLALSKVIQQLS